MGELHEILEQLESSLGPLTAEPLSLERSIAYAYVPAVRRCARRAAPRRGATR